MFFRIFLLATLLVFTPGLAKTQWEVGVLILGSSEDEAYQKDIDENILELSRSVARSQNPYRLSVIRELPDRNVALYLNPNADQVSWRDLFFRGPAQAPAIRGEMATLPRKSDEKTLFHDSVRLQSTFSKMFQEPKAHRMLVIYSHGLAYDGLRHLRLRDVLSDIDLKTQLEKYLPARDGEKPLDILWFDACYMANIETIYELQSFSDLFIGSEDAEFSAGAPFERFSVLSEGPDDVKKFAIDMARYFVESYSYMRAGSQKRSAFKSSSTISVVDTEKLSSFVREVAAFTDGLRMDRLTKKQRELVNRAHSRVKMVERPELVDMGSLFLELYEAKDTELEKPLFTGRARDELHAILFDWLELKGRGHFKRDNAFRVKAEAPTPGSLLVYGYDKWTKGFEKDKDTLEKIPSNMGPTQFVAVPKVISSNAFEKGPWPSRPVNQYLYLTPFTVDVREFHYFFANPRTLKPMPRTLENVLRPFDLYVYESQNGQNPILFSGYTQGVGSASKRYTGLTIMDPKDGVRSQSYPDLEFQEATHWGNL